MPKNTSRKYLRKSIRRNRKLSKKKQSYKKKNYKKKSHKRKNTFKRKMIKRNLKLGGTDMEQKSRSDEKIEYLSKGIYDTASVLLNSPHINKGQFIEMVKNTYELDLISPNAPPGYSEVFTDKQRIEILKKHLLRHKYNGYLSEDDYEEIIKDETKENLLANCLRIWNGQRK